MVCLESCDLFIGILFTGAFKMLQLVFRKIEVRSAEDNYGDM